MNGTEPSPGLHALASPAQLPAAAALLALALSLLWLTTNRDDWSAIPGPPASSWLLGHLQQVNRTDCHRRFFQANTQKYGGLFRFRLASLRVVVVSDPVLVQQVIGRGADVGPKPPAMYDAVDELFSEQGRRSFFSTHSREEWRVVRKGTAPAFSQDNMRKLFPRMMQITNELLDVLAAQARDGGGTAEVEVAEAAMRTTLDLIGEVGYGYDFQARRYGKCELLEAVPGLLTEFTLRSTNPIRTLTHRTLLRWLPEARAYRQRVQIVHRWWRVLLASVRATDVAAADAAGDTGLRACFARLPLSDELLIPQLAVYLIAGFETTAHSIAWALYEVAADPRVQAALEEELQGAGLLGAGRRPLEYGDLAALPYLNAVLKEAMRLHPVASNGTARQLDAPLTLGGYRLRRGTILWIPLIGLLTSRHNYERAEEFWPERWLLEGEGAAAAGGGAGIGGGRVAAAPAAAAAGAGPTPVGNAAAPAKSYLPFSDGARDCVGQNLAVTEARAVLAALCGRFRLALAPGMGDRAAVRDQEVLKLTLQLKHGVRLLLQERQ